MEVFVEVLIVGTMTGLLLFLYKEEWEARRCREEAAKKALIKALQKNRSLGEAAVYDILRSQDIVYFSAAFLRRLRKQEKILRKKVTKRGSIMYQLRVRR